jgi:ribonuclease J
MTRITVYGGAREIGGNQILLEDPGGALWLDFGKPLGTYDRYFSGLGGPLVARGLHDHLLMGLLPPLAGLYREDLLPPAWAPRAVLAGARRVRPDAILLTHAHLDHCGSLPYVDPAIPVVMSPVTAMALKHLQDWGAPHLDGEYRYVKQRVLKHGALTVGRSAGEGRLTLRQAQIPLAEDWTEAAASAWSAPPDARPWEAPPVIRSDRVGRLPFRWLPVDHSVPGAGAFAVQTEAGWVVYTGDLRRHGLEAALTDAFIREAAALRPTVLITEGTNADAGRPGPSPTEAEVADRMLEAVRGERGLVVAIIPGRNPDRLISLYGVARAVGRQLLLTERETDFLRHLRLVRPELPDPDEDPYLCTYYRPRSGDPDWHRFWRDRGRRPPRACGSSRYLHTHPEEYLICFGPGDMVELVGLELGWGGLLLYANHQPHDAEQEAGLQRLRAWAGLLGLRLVGADEPGYHASGHLDGEALQDLIAAIKPGRLVAVHTQSPDFFAAFGGPDRVTVPEPGQTLLF